MSALAPSPTLGRTRDQILRIFRAYFRPPFAINNLREFSPQKCKENRHYLTPGELSGGSCRSAALCRRATRHCPAGLQPHYRFQYPAEPASGDRPGTRCRGRVSSNGCRQVQDICERQSDHRRCISRARNAQRAGPVSSTVYPTGLKAISGRQLPQPSRRGNWLPPGGSAGYFKARS